VLAVNLRFQNELQKLHFLSIWQPLAEYVKAAEPVALAFEVLQADNDPCNIMVYERCASRACNMISYAVHGMVACMCL
jgi:hypothetical protein